MNEIDYEDWRWRGFEYMRATGREPKKKYGHAHAWGKQNKESTRPDQPNLLPFNLYSIMYPNIERSNNVRGSYKDCVNDVCWAVYYMEKHKFHCPLLRKMLEDPRDPGPIGVYADWLEDQGNCNEAFCVRIGDMPYLDYSPDWVEAVGSRRSLRVRTHIAHQLIYLFVYHPIIKVHLEGQVGNADMIEWPDQLIHLFAHGSGDFSQKFINAARTIIGLPQVDWRKNGR